MQGNEKGYGIRSQSYRTDISDHVDDLNIKAEIIDPDQTDANRLQYSNEQADEMFFRYCRIAGNVDLLISYLPAASMGSAVEM